MSEMSEMKMILPVVVLLFLASVHADHESPHINLRNVDVIAAAQIPCYMPQATFDNLKQSIWKVLESFESKVSSDQLDTVRLSVILYWGTAKVVIPFHEHCTLGNTDEWLENFLFTMKVPENPDCVNKDLTEGVQTICDMQQDEGQEDHTKLFLIFSDGDNTGSRPQLRKGSTCIHANHSSVIYIDVPGEFATRDLEARDAQQSTVRTILEYNMDYFFATVDINELVITTTFETFLIFIQTHIIVFDCQFDVYACHKTCGIGLMAQSDTCDIYLGLTDPTFLEQGTYNFVGRCCVQPCPGQGGPAPLWRCKDLPPANGHIN